MEYIWKRWDIQLDVAPVNPIFDSLDPDYRWQGRLYCNPPYNKKQKLWVKKCIEEFKYGLLERVVFLIPARTDTELFKICWDNADEIIFLQGRVRFKGAKGSAPFPSMLVVFEGNRVRDKSQPLKFSLLSLREIEDKQ